MSSMPLSGRGYAYSGLAHRFHVAKGSLPPVPELSEETSGIEGSDGAGFFSTRQIRKTPPLE
jgi:hypothetical protein